MNSFGRYFVSFILNVEYLTSDSSSAIVKTPLVTSFSQINRNSMFSTPCWSCHFEFFLSDIISEFKNPHIGNSGFFTTKSGLCLTVRCDERKSLLPLSHVLVEYSSFREKVSSIWKVKRLFPEYATIITLTHFELAYKNIIALKAL